MSVSKEQIDAWKAKHGKIYKLAFPQGDVIYRTLTREDYSTIMIKQANGLIADAELETVKTCMLTEMSDEVLDSAAGIVALTYENIMVRSGFVNVESEEL